MSSVSEKMRYPLLDVESTRELRSSARRWVQGSGSMAAAFAIHLVVFFAAEWVSEKGTPPKQEKAAAKQSFVVVEPVVEKTAKKPEPEREGGVSNTTAKDTPAKTEPAPLRKKKPKKSLQKSKEVEQFMDLGSLGGVKLGVTGSGGSGFKVAVGKGGLDGAIATSSKVIEKASSAETEQVEKAPKGSLRAVSVRDLSEKARPNHRHNRRLKAPYPQELRRDGIVGEVQAVLTVMKDGTVGTVKILRSAHPAFSKAALPILKQFIFEPAIDRRGAPVISKIKLTYRFTLE